MNRGTAFLVVAFALVAVAGIAAAGPVGTVVAQDDPVTTNETGEPDETQSVNETDISPGELFSGAIGVQRAEIAGEVELRAFEVGLNRTASPEERADLVASRVNRTEERLAAIERRQRELRERRAAGELSPGGFAARMAETSARAEAIKREANRSTAVAADLPESVRGERGLTEARLGHLRERAGNASAPEVAAIARGIGGNGVGGPLASDRRGPPEGARGGSGADRGPGAGEGVGERPEAGGGPEADDRPDRGNDGRGEGRPERGNETNDNAASKRDDAANATRTPDRSGNATSDRGATSEDRPGGKGPAEGAGSSSSAGGGERGNGSDAGDDERGNGSDASGGERGNGSDASGGERGNGSDAGEGERGNGSNASEGATNAIGSATNRLVGPLVDSVDTVRHALAGIGG